MKKVLTSLLMVIGFVTWLQPVFADEAPKVIVDSKEVEFDTPPMVEEGRTWVPMTPIFKSFGYNISWNPQTKTATVSDENSGIKASFNSDSKNIPYVQTGIDKIAVLNKAPFVKNGRTYIQLNIFADIFCKKLSYDNKTNTVNIASQYYPTLLKVTKDGLETVEVDQNFRILVETDGNYHWAVSPNANYAYYGQAPSINGLPQSNSFNLYFKCLTYSTNSSIKLLKVNNKTGKLIDSISYPIYVKNPHLPMLASVQSKTKKVTGNCYLLF